MNLRRSLAAAVVAVLCAGPCRGMEVQDTYRSAYEAFLQGRLEDAASAYRYLDMLGVDGAAPTINLALVARDAGEPETALPLWTKATKLAPADPFPWNQRGWCYLSMGRYPEARESFRRAVEVSSTTAMTAEGNFGLAWTDIQDSNLKKSIAELQGAFSPSPYLLPAVNATLGRVAARMHLWNEAETYLKKSLLGDPLHSLAGDSMQPELLSELAEAYERGAAPKAAWLAYKDVLDLDPANAEAARGMERMSKVLEEPADRLVPARRLAGPLLQESGFQAPPASDSTNHVRVGLYSNGLGVPGFARRFFFMSGSDFKIVDPKLGQIGDAGHANEQWEVAANPETGIVELRLHGQLSYATKQPFRIEPSSAGASVLIKSPDLADIKGIDIGDLEVRGVVEAVPTPYGIQLVNEVGVEQYLFGQVSAAMQEILAEIERRSAIMRQSMSPWASLPKEALKAQAVVSRTRLEWLKYHAARDAVLRMDISDSARGQAYHGLLQESDEPRQAVLDTAGVKLTRGGQAIDVREHPYCGGVTEDGVVDRDARKDARTAYDMEAMTHGFPDPELYDSKSALPPASWARWLRVFDGSVLRARLEKVRDLGRLHHIRVARRSAAGRAEALEVVGAHGRTLIEGEDPIREFLSPGGLRSTYFTLQPLYDGRALKWLLVWGIGTGDAHGMCVAGALGMAQAGRDYKAILDHYYPGVVVEGWRGGTTNPGKGGAPGKTSRSELGRSRRAIRARQKAQAKGPKAVAAAPRKKSPTPAAAGDKKPATPQP